MLMQKQVHSAQEQVCQHFRRHKKFVEKEITAHLNRLAEQRKHEPTTLVDTFSVYTARLQKLRQDYAQLLEAEVELSSHVVERLSKHCDQEEQLKVHILDFMLRRGYQETAKLYCEQVPWLNNFNDAIVYSQIESICEEISKFDFYPALEFCAVNRSKLSQMGSRLEFRLHTQVFLGLLPQADKAVHYARKNFTRYSQEPCFFEELVEVMGLLGFNSAQRPQLAGYERIAKSDDLRDLFRLEAYAVYSLPQDAPLIQIVQTGASVLKTIFCGSQSELRKQRECAACDPLVYQLAKDLPTAHIRQTQVRCCISGNLIQEGETPYRMPSGYLIAESAVKKLSVSKSGNGKLVCPKTAMQFAQDELRKVYFS